MIGVCKRVTLALVIVLMVGALQPVLPNEVEISCTPAYATTNSIWNFRVDYTQASSDPKADKIIITGLGTPITLYDSTWPETDPPTTDPPDPDAVATGNAWKTKYVSPSESSGDLTVYRVAVSRGLNMSKNLTPPPPLGEEPGLGEHVQQPHEQRVAVEDDPAKLVNDIDNPLLLRDPRGNGMWYASALVCNDDGSAKTISDIKVTVTFLPPEDDPEATPQTPIDASMSVVVHASRGQYPNDDPTTPYDDTVDWGSPQGLLGCDWLETYPGNNWPELFFGPDPLVLVTPSSVVPGNPSRPDDGSSSTTFDFRARYYNSDGLPPLPWLPSSPMADEFGADGTTGVVLYLDYMNIFDPLDELYPFPELRNRGYKPHYMRPESGEIAMGNGTDYLYRLQPVTRWRTLLGTDGVFPPTPYVANEFMSLLMGNYHYFFACSDDSLAFENNYQLFSYNMDQDRWGYNWGQRSGVPLDPSTPIPSEDVEFPPENPEDPPRVVTIPDGYSRFLLTYDGRPYMPKLAGRTYSTWGDDVMHPSDWQLYVDRYNRVPGRFEPTWGLYPPYAFPYPHPSTEHPEVIVALEGFGYAPEVGRAWFMGTLEPYYRAVNPSVQQEWDPDGYYQWGNRMESSGATLDSTLTFRIKYYQNYNEPPRDIRLYINNQPIKVINSASVSCTFNSVTDTFTTLSSHALNNGDAVYITSSSNDIPTGSSSGTRYFVVNRTATTFQLSSAQGGSVLDWDSDGAGLSFYRPLGLDNGGFTSYAMRPAPIRKNGVVQVPPYNYTAGIEYICTVSGRQLGAGPHTYFFEAYDGKAVAIYPARPERWVYGGIEINDGDVPSYQDGYDPVEMSGYDNNYCPGPYINNPCVLSEPAVNPTSGVPGQKFKFRVKYTDVDGPREIVPGVILADSGTPSGQQPYEASVYIDTGTTQDLGYGSGVIKAQMVKEDPTDIDYTDGVWYTLDTASLDSVTFVQGVRRYRFEFIDDWGRQTDANDRVRGEVTRYPSTGIWIDGPTIDDNPRPRLTNGKAESTDGTANSATLWKFSTKYLSKRSIAPQWIAVYIGELQSDGATIVWDSGHDMVKADPSDTTYNDGCDYVYLTQLQGNESQSSGSPSAATSTKLSSLTLDALSPTLPDGRPAYVSNRAIIRLKPAPVGVNPDAYRDTELAKLGVTRIRQLSLPDTYLVKLGSSSTVKDVVTNAKKLPSVRNATPDYLQYPSAIPNDPMWDKLWGLRMINAPQVWDAHRGDEHPVTVAVVDSGVSPTHPDLQGRLLTGRDMTADLTKEPPDDPDDTTPGDYEGAGHGTHVAGTIAAQGNNATGVVGVCWSGVKILPVKVFPDDGSGAATSDVIDGLHFAMEEGAQVVNLSLGSAAGTPEYREKINELTMNGIIVCAAAGNDGVAGVGSPAMFDDCIAVAAVNEDEALAFYSNYGPEIDIAAPGGEDFDGFPGTNGQIWSTWYDGADGYESIQGTSMACPHVAGAAALLLSTGMSATDARNKLLWGARVPKSGTLVPIAYGHGILDVNRSLTATQPTDPIIPDPVAPGTYFYAFEASDGNNLATYVPNDDPSLELRSPSAGCKVQETLTTTDNTVYQCSMYPIVGTLGAAPVRPDTLIDPIVYRWPKGVEADSVIVSRIDDYVCIGQYYGPTMVYRDDAEDPAYAPSISQVLGIYLTAELSGINYFYAEDGTPGGYSPDYGIVFLGRELPYGTGRVWIQYRHGDAYTGDYTLDRWTGKFTFVRPQDPEDLFKVDYFFTTRDLTDPTEQGTVGPIGANTPPTLTSPTLTPEIGDSEDDFTYTVIYKDSDGPNGQAPTFVRVVIDHVPYDMTPVTQGTPSYRSGVTYSYVTTILSGTHDYYFEASDGQALVIADDDSSTLAIEPIPGPWLNDPPELTNGLVDPDPLGAVSAQDSVTYRVTYTDIDNDAPYAGTPKVYVDNPSETEYNGTVAARLTDPMEPTKYRSIRITGATFASGQLTGKLLQVTNGALIGRVYLIATNASDTLKLMTDDLVADGFVVGNTFTIGALQMHKVDTTQQNYVTGVTYEVTVPQLAVGEHRYHFKAASTLNPPVWLDPAPTMSEWARFPLSGELSGPTVAILDDPLDPNHDPVLTPVDPIVTPTSGEPTDTYQFFVSYKDSDGDPPGYHDRLLGYVRVVFNDGSFSGDMTPMGTATYTTGRQFTLSSNSLPIGRHKFHFEASDGQAAVRWPALLAGLDPTANDPEVTVGGDTPPVVGETRVVATVDRTQPETSTPVIDMITSPIIASDGEAATLWGAGRAALMQINIWDPVAQQYQTYEGGSLPSILAGTAMWILPDFTYPAEAVNPSSPPTMVSATDVLDYGKLYRLLKPVGTLYNQATDCPISLKAGWNQFGSPYLSSTTLGSATVTYGSQTVSLAQAERNGWIRGYAWMWDPAAAVINSANGYKLVHPTLSSANSRTIDPWRGYWIKSLVDCTLTLNAP